MEHKEHFHGSDLEKIEKIYGIKKEELVSFSANVNPLGLSELVKAELSKQLDCLTAYPDREYTGLRKAIGSYVNSSFENVLVGNGASELISLLAKVIKPKKALFVAAHSPVVARIEGLEGIVVGDEQSLTTCLCQHIRIVQVVNQTNEIRVVALFLQAVVDARVQIAWVLVVPFVVIRTSHHPTAQRKDAQGLGEGASEVRKHHSARPLLYLV